MLLSFILKVKIHEGTKFRAFSRDELQSTLNFFLKPSDSDDMYCSFFKKSRFFIYVLCVCPFCISPHDSANQKYKNIYPHIPTEVKWQPLFPKALFLKESFHPIVPACFAGPAEYSSIRETKERAKQSLQSVLLNNDIFALYGKPNAYTMGILGQYSLEKIEAVMNEFITIYDEANGDRGLIPAFYIIYGTCWPKGDIGILTDAITEQYINFAQERGWYVFLDHQIGKYSVTEAMDRLLPFLKYNNVHLALDPEWRTTKPMEEIGYVTAEEINEAQQTMQDYIIEHGITGRRMLVIHQFNAKMIKRRHVIKSNYERVQLIHCSDGFGPPKLKKETYAYNATAENMPLKSFKLFLKPTVAGAGYDIPLMKPEEVFLLEPRPYVIMYQ